MTLKIVICGDTHGHFHAMYDRACELGADIVLQLGDTGIFPDPDRADAASRRHGIPLDCLDYLLGKRHVPVPTYFIKGNHEDFDFLDKHVGEIIPGWYYVPQKRVLSVGGIRFGVLGGNYSSKFFDKMNLPQARRRHFTQFDIEAIEREGFDVLLSHDGPLTPALPKGAQLLTELIQRTRPSHVYHGHHHYHYETELGSSRIIGLDKVRPGRTFMMPHSI